MHYPSKPKSFILTPSRRRICKPLARGSRVALARHCLKDLRIRKHITKGVGLQLQREVASMCSDITDSILRNKTKQAMEGFNWENVLGEMKLRAPTLLSLLQSCTKTRKARRYTKCVIGLITAILCKHRRPSACLVQRLISVILYSGHASKRVSLHLHVCTHFMIYIFTPNVYIPSIGVQTASKVATVPVTLEIHQAPGPTW